jgi:ferric-dicitrate binding protein FerR (iron transport regulator)
MDGRLLMSWDDDNSAEVTLAEAAAWVVRLRRHDRDADTETALQCWLQDPTNAKAFAHTISVWGIIPDAARFVERAHGNRHSMFGVYCTLPPVLSALIITFLAGIVLLFGDPVYITKNGEQETIT